MHSKERIARFKAELTELINRHSMECECGNTPDYILSEAAVGFMLHFGEAIDRRENHFTNDKPGPTEVSASYGSPDSDEDAGTWGCHPWGPRSWTRWEGVNTS